MSQILGWCPFPLFLTESGAHFVSSTRVQLPFSSWGSFEHQFSPHKSQPCFLWCFGHWCLCVRQGRERCGAEAQDEHWVVAVVCPT